MIRVLALRARVMPSAMYPKSVLAPEPWSGSIRSRQSSTIQESKSLQDYERAAAILHGGRRNGSGADVGLKKPASDRKAQNSATRHSTSQPSRQNHPITKGQPQNTKQAKPQEQRGQYSSKQNRPRHHGLRKPVQETNNMTRSKKRKAGSSAEQRPSQRRRAEYLELKDEAHVRSTMQIPTPAHYPGIAPERFKHPKDFIHNAAQGISELRSQLTTPAHEVFRYTLTFESPTRTEMVIGEGRSKKAAETTAYLHILAKFHEDGFLSELVNKNSATKQIAKKAKAEEREAIIDIYNYAARFDLVPDVSAQEEVRRERGRKKKFVNVTIELPEQGIKVRGSALTAKKAEIQAALNFKKEAERYQAKQGSEALIIKDSTALTTDNANQFIEFFKIVRPGVHINIEKKEPSRKASFGEVPHRCQVTINNEAVGEPVEMMDKTAAEETAILTASVALKKSLRDLFPRYLRALKSGNGQILRPVSPVTMAVDEDCALVMKETLLSARRAGLPDEVTEGSPGAPSPGSRTGTFRRPLSSSQAQARGQNLHSKLREYENNPELADLRQKRADLPMNQYAAQVLDLVNNNVYSIIVGATGSGKTTQVPQILLEEAIKRGEGAACNVICTQPRRIAATSVARRVATERAERMQDSVGYHVRFDAKIPAMGGSITYCTTGILLQQLQHQPDEVLSNISHLVIDEVHERDMLIDFLLIILKKNMLRRKTMGKPTPQVVLMSATMDTELFASYFEGKTADGAKADCPALSVPGRTFPVKERYIDEILKDMNAAQANLRMMQADVITRDFLEVEERFRRENAGQAIQGSPGMSRDDRSVIDWKRERKISAQGDAEVGNEKENALVPYGLVACTIAHIAKTTEGGAILVFLPGLDEIVKVDEQLRQRGLGVDFSDESLFNVYKLHSSIPASQTTVFEPVSAGCRKVILSTNIAETSVTIPEVQYVVDTGKLREKQYDQMRRITTLQCTWISKSNSKQRAGRAGRVQNGNYYALFSKERYDSLRAIGLPELLRADLQEICLDIKAQQFEAPIGEFLAEAIEPPASAAVDAAVINLQALDALTDDEEITPLGRLLASLPVHPTLGKMIVLGIIFRCLDPILIFGAASAERPLFVQPLGRRQEANAAKLSFVEGSGSDHIAMLNAVRQLRQQRDERGDRSLWDFAQRNYLHGSAFKTIESTAAQIEAILVDAGLIPFTPPHQRSNSQLGDPSLNINSHKVPLIKALALAGVHPNLAVSAGGRSLRTPGERGALVHPSSTNAPRDKREHSNMPYGTLLSYSTMARSNDGNTLYLRDTTLSTPLMAALFGGKLKQNHERMNVIELDSWLPFYVSSSDRRTAKTIVEFRKALERLLAGAFSQLGQAVGVRRMGEQMGRGFLADDRVRDLFAEGLVEVLDRDLKIDDRVKERGWGGQKGFMDQTLRFGQRNSDRPGGFGGRGKEGKRSNGLSGFYEELVRRG